MSVSQPTIHMLWMLLKNEELWSNGDLSVCPFSPLSLSIGPSVPRFVCLSVRPSVRPVWGVNVFFLLFCYYYLHLLSHYLLLLCHLISFCSYSRCWCFFCLHSLAVNQSASLPVVRPSVRPAVRRQLVFILSMGFWIRNCLGFGCSFYRPRGFFQYYFYF